MSPRPSSLGVPCTLRFAVSKSSPSGNHPARLRGVPRGSGESTVTTASARGPLLARGTGGWDGEGGGERHALHRTAAHIRTTSASTGTRGGCPRSRLGTCVAAAPRARARAAFPPSPRDQPRRPGMPRFSPCHRLPGAAAAPPSLPSLPPRARGGRRNRAE